MADPFARKTYLHALPDDTLPLRFSLGKRSRAVQLQAFFKELEAVAGVREGSLELVVLTAYDWRRLLSAPYGWGLVRRVEDGVSIALPAGYPPRLIARWDAVRLRAARHGAKAPGSVEAFLDTYLGLEWAHARLLSTLARKRLSAPLREVSAAYLYQQSLGRLREEDKLGLLEAWARVQRLGAVENVAETGTEEAEEMEVTPRAFTYPRARTPFLELLGAQGELWLEALELGKTEGWDLTPAEVQVRVRARLREAARTSVEPL